MTPFKPTDIMVKPEPLQTDQGGIILPKPSKEQYGEVVAVGNEIDFLEKGQRVLYIPKNHVEIDGFHFIQEEMIIGICQNSHT